MSARDVGLPKVDEACRLYVGGLDLLLPCYWPSVSSVKTACSPLEYLRVLCTVGQPHYLLSAYDLAALVGRERQECLSLLEEAARRGTQVLLDCGSYESFWHRDPSWSTDRFHAVLASTPCNLAFGFDQHLGSDSLKEIVRSVVHQVAEDQKHSAVASVAPVVHAPREALPEAVLGVAQALHPVLIAVAERDLGCGIMERASTLLSIRRCLDEANCSYPVHLLGTGNPRSLILYSFCGASSFDGLEWCRTAVDHDTGLLHHFHQRELFETQTAAGSDLQIPYVETTLLHNLVYFSSLMNDLHGVTERREFLRPFFSDAFLARCEQELSGMFADVQ